jgi:hypothetical protein
MIKIERTEVYGWESAIHGMRNPMNSWDKSDSCFCFNEPDCEAACEMYLGPNDLKLMKNLIKAGSDHSKFMRMINVSCDITAPLYWWKEFDTYKVGTVRNSCSTMHKIHAKEFTAEDFSFENLMPDVEGISYFLGRLNYARKMYLETQDKRYWYSMIQFLPSSYNQKATVQLNYAVLRNMYHGRKNHKLDEWSIGFCNWVESLPYSELITMEGK